MSDFINMLGAITGDVIGSRYEFNNYRNKNFEIPTRKKAILENTKFTDDTILTVAIADILLKKVENDSKKMVKIIKKYCKKYPASYGCSFSNWLYSKNSKPYNSLGNGSAMRISMISWYAKNEEQVKSLSKKITEITHNHPEGIKGAEITAMCIYYAKIGKSKDFIKEYVSKYYNIDFDYETLKRTYCFNETCQKTVPQAIYCFLISNSFEDCLRTTVSIGGDTDTLCAISCAIASAYYHDDSMIINEIVFDNYLPRKFKKVLKNFWKKIIFSN